MSPEVLKVVKNNHLFSGLDPGLISHVVASSTRKTLGRNEFLFRKGDRADALWGVLSGRIVMQVSTDDGKELVLDTFKSGDVFGEVGVLDFGPRRVDAMAETRTELFRLERKQFLKHLQSSPELCFRVFSRLCADLRLTTETLEDTALYTLPGRLAKKLIMLAGGEEKDSTDSPIVLQISQFELARLLGVHRVSVSRQLGQWEKSGLLSLKRQRVEIRNVEALAELAAPGQNGNDRNREWGAMDLGGLTSRGLPDRDILQPTKLPAIPRMTGILAVDAAEYSRSLMTDAAGTFKRLKAGMRAIDRAIADGEGRLVSHTGDRVLAEFPETVQAYRAALAIQHRVDGLGVPEDRSSHSIFQIGVHYGQVFAGEDELLAEDVNIAIRLTGLSGAGGVCLSGQARDALELPDSSGLQFLGKHQLKNVTNLVSVYAAQRVPLFRRILLRLETLIPRRMRLASALATAVLAGIALWLVAERFGFRNAPVQSPPSRSIAVLPFEALGDPDHDYLAAGLASEIRASLGSIPDLLVIGSASSKYFEDRGTAPTDIGKALHAAWLLEGSVGRTGDLLTASARLIESATGMEAWNHEYSGNWRDIGVFRSAIVGLTGDSLLGGASDSQGGYGLLPATDNDEAHVLYLRAENYQTQGGFCTEASKAVPLLERAVELDPGFGEAWARLARAYGGGCPQIQNRADLADDAMYRALALAPESPMVLGTASMRRLGAGDLLQARELAEQALALNPNDPDALYALALIYLEEDNWVAGYEVVDRLMQLDPLNFRTLSYYKYRLVTMGHWEELLGLAERAMTLYPDNELPYSWMAKASLYLGDRLTAIEMQRRAMPFGSPIDLWTGLDYQWDAPVRRRVRLASPRAYLGQFEAARQLIRDEYTREEDDSSPGNVVGYLVNMGEIEALAGNFAASIELFERAIEQLPGKEQELFHTNTATAYDPWISLARQSDPSLALLYAYRRVGLADRADIIADIFQQNVNYEGQLYGSVDAVVDNPVSYAEAQFHAIEGRTHQALTTLRFWQENDKAIFTYIGTDPFLESLHGEPEFQAIVAEIEAELAEVRAQYYANRVEQAVAGNDG